MLTKANVAQNLRIYFAINEITNIETVVDEVPIISRKRLRLIKMRHNKPEAHRATVHFTLKALRSDTDQPSLSLGRKWLGLLFVSCIIWLRAPVAAAVAAAVFQCSRIITVRPRLSSR